MTTTTPADPYRRRREAGEASRAETRRRLLVAADELFRRDGYVATTVTGIARHAGVSLQTLYLAWDSKRALLRAATDASASDSLTPMSTGEWRELIRSRVGLGDTDLADRLETMCEVFVEVASRSAPYWRLYRQAAAVDPEIAADWDELTARRRQTVTTAARVLPREGRRGDLTDRGLRNTLFALLSPDVYDLLTGSGDLSFAQYVDWLKRTLVAAICEQ